MNVSISTSYFDYNSGSKHFYAVDNLSIISLTAPPKEPDSTYCKKLVYEVFEFFGLDKHIKSLVWENYLTSNLLYNWMPIIHFNYIFDIEIDKKCRAIYNDLCKIVASTWSKDY